MSLILWIGIPVLLLTFALLGFVAPIEDELPVAEAPTGVRGFRPYLVHSTDDEAAIDHIAAEVERHLRSEAELTAEFSANPSPHTLWAEHRNVG
jgi:hypothetical protein